MYKYILCWESTVYLGYVHSEIESWKYHLDLVGLKIKIADIFNNPNMPDLDSFYFIEPISMYW